jgi:hypothetical protein
VRVVPDVPSGPDDPVAALRTANAPLREVIQAKDELLAARDAQVTVLAAQAGALAARVTELERRPGKDSPLTERLQRSGIALSGELCPSAIGNRARPPLR